LGRGANSVRIIGGEHRGRRLSFVPVTGLRPTPDRVRETLFNWLRNDLRGAHCLDLYAGSGALTFEALSRGVASVTAVERHRLVAKRLRENAALLGLGDRCAIVQADVSRFLRQPSPRRYDIVFVDPPFAESLVDDVVTALIDGGWCMPDAALYLEQDAAQSWTDPGAQWRIDREGRAGQSAQRLLRRVPEDAVGLLQPMPE
jgi:16S rRNA (guanine966-N2)-methyltransferase